jgi:acetyl-CoA C-acetyltransferase
MARLQREVVHGALADAGLTADAVDGFFCDSNTPGIGPVDMLEYLGLNCTYTESGDMGGATYVAYVGHAAAAIAAGKCRVAVIVLAGLPYSDRSSFAGRQIIPGPAAAFEINGSLGGHGPVADYAMTARRHMYEFGTTSEQLAWIKVASSVHASHNPDAVLREPVTVEEIVESPLIADPLHRLDCCIISDGGGALVVVHPDVARELDRAAVAVRGHGEAHKDPRQGQVDLTYTAARKAGSLALAEAGVTPRDIDYASLYDSFTITVLITLEDLGFCERGTAGRFVEDGGLISPGGRLPFNTDGGGLSSNHPGNRGGMTKVIEAVRQLRGEAHPELQVPDCELAVVSGTGARLSTRHYSSSLILERFS